ncbi:MAG: hypothetical protein ACJLTB_02075 [Algoriphagus aquaeductus]|uniref:hypothetical protein n=1 Tax=Algoriphagus aquaeductus TaxID=475299 RepID=UPI003879ABAF
MTSLIEELENKKNIITARQFLLPVSSKRSSISLGKPEKQKLVKGLIQLTNKNYFSDELILTNLVFEDTLRISGEHNSPLNLGTGIIFRDCIFLRPLVISYCKSKNTKDKDFSQKSGAIQIINGSYKLIQISGCEFPFGIDIISDEEKNVEIDWFESHQNHFSKAGYSFERVTFKSKLELTRDKIENLGLSFRDCESTTPIRIESVNSPNISFLGNETKFEEDLRIWGGSLKSLTWNNGTFNNEIDISAVRISESLTISGSTFNNRFLFKRKDQGSQIRNFSLPKAIWIEDSKFQNGFQFDGFESKSEKLDIIFSEKTSGVIDFRNTFFKEVALKGNNFNNSFFLRDCSYDKLTITHFFNKALISFNNNNPQISDGEPIEILIQNSNLGNTEFYDFDFSIYPTIKIIDSRVDNIFVNGGRWFETNQLQFPESKKDQGKILSQKREIYRQLKLASEKQSDRITALEFKAKEVETHRLYLELGKVKKADRWAILAGTTNNHGQDWIKPLWSIILISLGFFFPLFFIADPEINFWPDVSKAGWNFFWSKLSDHSKVIPQLFNPARRVSDMFEVIQYPFWVYFLDGLHRILLAFFIFQIVSAFRKFVK